MTIIAERQTMEQAGPHLAGCLLRGQVALDRHEMYTLELVHQAEPGSSLETVDDAVGNHPHLVIVPWHATDRIAGAQHRGGAPRAA